jgi:hypothetical protein
MNRLRRALPPVLAWCLFLRLTLAAAALLVAFPFLATGPLRPLLGGLFDLGLPGLASVALLALVVARALVLVTETASRSGPVRLLPRFVDGRATAAADFADQRRLGIALTWDPEGTAAGWLRRWKEWLGPALALPTIAVAVRESGAAGLAAELAAVLLGLGLYLALRFVADLVERAFTPPELEADAAGAARPGALRRRADRREPGRLARALRRAAIRALRLPTFGAGYVRERTPFERAAERNRREQEAERGAPPAKPLDPSLRFELLPGHAAAMSFALVTLVLYALLGAANFPGRGLPGTPALAYVLVVLLMAVWLASAVSFWADRFRVPVVTLLVAVSALSYSVGSGDHFFRLLEPGGAGAGEAAAGARGRAADERELDRRFAADCAGPVVLVTAAGGGITSAAWSTAVLTRLAEHPEHGGRFLGSLALVSGVSGGSVGAMFFVDGLPDLSQSPAPLAPAAGEAIRRAASSSSLEAVGWGLAYPDLARTLLSSVLTRVAPFVDRSWALERSWAERLPSRARRAPATAVPTLAAWRREFLAGAKPALILNATSVETGQRFRMATLRLPEAAEGAGQFFTLFPEHDLALPTAARLSATFPLVSTAARGRDAAGSRVAGAHFVDGGYYDNSGQLSALELLDDALGRLAPRTDCRPRIALVRLEPFDPESRELASARSDDGWTTATFSPITTLLAVRSASQVDRNAWELATFAAKWRESGFEIVPIPLRLGLRRAPLSWHLSRRDVAQIEAAAEQSLASEAVRTLWSLYERPAAAPMAAPVEEKELAFEPVMAEPGAPAP